MPTLHVTNGDCAAGVLRQFLADPVIIEADVLHEGPAPAVDDDAWLDVRARFLSNYGMDFSATRADLERSDRALDDARFDEVVLWFEHDLFDQLQIVRTLSRLARRPDAESRTRLICVDRVPGVERFVGLGQLDARQLASLAAESHPVTRREFEAAAHVWDAFRAADPSELNAIRSGASRMTDSIDAYPFLRRAVGRFLAEYPSTKNGLSTTLTLALQELEASPLDGVTLFRRVQAREAAPFLGDLPFYAAVRRLAAVRRPLVAISEMPSDSHELGHGRIALTDVGREVVAGRLDATAQNGIDEWRGGVHLQGVDRSPWRWDNVRETLVSWSELPTS